MADTNINKENAKALADATDKAWESIMKTDADSFGKYFRDSFEAQIEMFPNMVNKDILSTLESVNDKTLVWKLSGAGGGGYLVLVSVNSIPGTFQIKIRRKG